MPPLTDTTGDVGGDPTAAPLVAPRFGDWVWRPWYAKLWWGTTTVYWAGAFSAQWLPSLRPVFQNDQFPIVFLILHPFTIFPVLGFGFARAWVRYCDAVELPGGQDENPGHDEVIGVRRWTPRNVDPRNRTSVFHPANPASAYQRLKRFSLR